MHITNTKDSPLRSAFFLLIHCNFSKVVFRFRFLKNSNFSRTDSSDTPRILLKVPLWVVAETLVAGAVNPRKTFAVLIFRSSKEIPGRTLVGVFEISTVMNSASRTDDSRITQCNPLEGKSTYKLNLSSLVLEAKGAPMPQNLETFNKS